MSTLEIPGYTVQRMLGKGGMATVYLAVQEKFEREVALKVMAPALSADEGFRERFLREAKIVAKISHPHIVAVYDVNEVNGIHYIAMEYHPGGDLKARLRDGLSVREAIGILRDMAKALDYAHSKGYLHRDIKPDNILFRADGSAVLTDFGIAKATEGDANLTQMGMVAGTPKYMSPEQARGQPLDADSDLYSLGVVLFEMLTGRLPYEASDPIALGIQHMNAPIPKLEGRIAHFQPLIDRLLAKNAAQRPQSGAQLVREIDAIEKGFDYDITRESDTHNETIVRPAFRKSSAAVAIPANAASALANVDAATIIAPAAAGHVTAAPSAMPTPNPVAGKSSSLAKLAALAALLVVLGGGVWWYAGHRAETAQAARLTAALDAGSAAFARQAFTWPADDNALAHYRAALQLQPGNVEANAGIAALVAALQTQAQAAIAMRDVANAEHLLAQLQSVPAEPAVLADLRKNLELAKLATRQALAAPAAEKPAQAKSSVPTVATAGGDSLQGLRISGMLGSARQALEDGDAAAAISRYQQVLKLDPQNSEAKAGLKQARAR
jgi:serine/threonine-protein kinase PpkA